MKQQVYHAYRVSLVVIVLGACLQWLLLSGSSPLNIFTTFQKMLEAANPAVLGSRIQMHRPDFQTGMVFPQWGTTAYSAQDANWTIGLKEIQEQAAAKWIELTINFYQLSPTSTQVLISPHTPTPEAVAQGIRAARAMNYRVFVVPLLTVGGKVPWSGSIHLRTARQLQAWFDSYWQTFRPYVAAAAQSGAEELAIGTELELLQQAPAPLWEKLIERTHQVFPGRLTYDMNWSYNIHSLPSWMRNPYLTFIGVSAYYPLVSVQVRLKPDLLPELWKENVGAYLDSISLQLGKPVLISEIGYRDSSDALYSPWRAFTSAPPDPAEQAAAYNAAMMNVMFDPHIAGIFVWAWSVPVFEPNWRPAAQVIKRWYTSTGI